MKKVTINGIFLLLMISNIYGQITGTLGDLIFEDTLSLKPRSNWISIPDSVNNIWEVGKPDKIYFDLGYNDDFAILTDSNDFYSNNCNNYFDITIPSFGYTWGEGILSFYHKFDTDTLQDGGVIEVSYDNGNSWINILDDNNHIRTHFIGLYEDTISGGEYGFSGKSNGWQYVELYWHWVALVKKKSTLESLNTPIIRFKFVSDNNNTNKEGWMIDNVIFRGYDVVGSVKNTENIDIQIYPNPTDDYFVISSKNKSIEDFSFKLFDTNGKLVKYIDIVDKMINIKDINSGTYIYKLQKDNEILTGKIIKN